MTTLVVCALIILLFRFDADWKHSAADRPVAGGDDPGSSEEPASTRPATG
jgi:hypothetical protein